MDKRAELLDEMVGKRVRIEEHDEIPEPMNGKVIGWSIVPQYDGVPMLVYDIRVFDIQDWYISCSPSEITIKS